jgi:AcrR family transcriptional regulator
MPRPAREKPARKPVGRYHHGDLQRAMIQEAVRIIHKQGVDALTLRQVGQQLGVSRTALYRHFADKRALLGAVAAEGFRTLRAETANAYDAAGRGDSGFRAMGLAYVDFALRHPAHYRIMFGGFVASGKGPAGVTDPDADAFQVLVDAIIEQQRAGLVRAGDPQQLAVYIWSTVHGIAMLALDGLLPPSIDASALMRFANDRLRTGIRPDGGA